jgi:DNA ligase (NAD+)
VEHLVKEGLIENAADIFTLTKGDLEPLERFAEKSAENLVDAIDAAKKVTLARFINALGISHVGEETAIKLAEEFKTLDNVMKADVADLESIGDVGPQVSASIYKYFKDEKNKKLIQDLLKNGVSIKSSQFAVRGSKLSGKIFVLTGTLASMSRDEAKDKIRGLGGEISESVSKNTSAVIVGENPGSKLDKARNLGVKIFSEDGFLKLL